MPDMSMWDRKMQNRRLQLKQNRRMPDKMIQQDRRMHIAPERRMEERKMDAGQKDEG